MSSILDALKKAEQESTTERSAETPWSTPLPAQAHYRQRTRRWWVPLGIVVGLCVSGVFLWKIRQPDITPLVDSMTAAPALLSPKPNQATPPSVAEAPKSNLPVAQQQQVQPSKITIGALPRPATGNKPASTVQPSAPIAAIPPVQPAKKSLRTITPAEAPRVQPSSIPKKAPLQTVVPTSESALVPAVDPNRRPADSAKTTGKAMEGVADTGKFFRSDPRIDLQALVWAPEAAARFVVINNRLIKEGGSVDNIVVVQINPDDVLLAEGPNRWHEAFKIR